MLQLEHRDGLGDETLKKSLIRNVHLVRRNFYPIDGSHGQPQGNRLTREFKIGETHVLCFGVVNVFGGVNFLPELPLFFF